MMPHRLPIVVVLVAAGLVLSVGTPDGVFLQATRAEETAAERPPPQAEIAVLIERLSDDDYRVREPASTELVRIGIAARPMLVKALESPDVETRHRAARILTIIVNEDFQTRLAAFTADVDGSNQTDLPGWGRFGDRLRQDKFARALFSEMYRSESELLGVYHRSPDEGTNVSRAFNNRCDAIQEISQTYVARWQSEISLGTITTLLLIGSEGDVLISDKVGVLVNNLISRPVFSRSMQARATQPLLRKLLGDWVAKSALMRSASVQTKNLRLAMAYNLQEGLKPALQIVHQTTATLETRVYAALAIGQLGSRENLPDLEPLLKDKSIYRRSVPINNIRKQIDVQMRDVALAVMLHLTEQELSDYGFGSAKTSDGKLFDPSSLLFLNDEDRSVALAKWKKWSSKRQSVGTDAVGRKKDRKDKRG